MSDEHNRNTQAKSVTYVEKIYLRIYHKIISGDVTKSCDRNRGAKSTQPPLDFICAGTLPLANSLFLDLLLVLYHPGDNCVSYNCTDRWGKRLAGNKFSQLPTGEETTATKNLQFPCGFHCFPSSRRILSGRQEYRENFRVKGK